MQAILAELGVPDDRPTLDLWNKVDLLETEPREALEARAHRAQDVFVTSAVTGEGLDPMLAALTAQLQGTRHCDTLSLGFEDGQRRAWLFERDLVQAERQGETGFELDVRWSDRQKQAFAKI